MTADQYIAHVELNNARLFAGSRIEITAESFRAQLRRAHAAGVHEGRNGKYPNHPPDFMTDMMKGFIK